MIASSRGLTPESNFYIIYGVRCVGRTLHIEFVRQSRSSQVEWCVNSRILSDRTPGIGDYRRGSQKYCDCVTKLDIKPKVYCPYLALAMAFGPQPGSHRTCFHQPQKLFSAVGSKLGSYCFLWALPSDGFH